MSLRSAARGDCGCSPANGCLPVTASTDERTRSPIGLNLPLLTRAIADRRFGCHGLESGTQGGDCKGRRRRDRQVSRCLAQEERKVTQHPPYLELRRSALAACSVGCNRNITGGQEMVSEIRGISAHRALGCTARQNTPGL